MVGRTPRLRRTPSSASTSLITLFLIAIPALACNCRRLDICDVVHAPVLFIGEVIDGGITSITQDPWRTNVNRVRFKVLENFRGLPSGTRTIDIGLAPADGWCSPIPYYSGRKYLVIPTLRDGKFYDGNCYQARDLEKDVEDVQQVRKYFEGKLKTNLQGQVATSFKLLPGATVTASRNGKTFSATTNAKGEYRLELPSAGEYNVNATLVPYTSGPMERAFVPNQGCAVHYIGLAVDNSISGQVLDSAGKALKDARVGLVDVSEGPATNADPKSILTSFVFGHDLTFKFDHIPPGRYLLVSNPDGPDRKYPSKARSIHGPATAQTRASSKSTPTESTSRE